MSRALCPDGKVRNPASKRCVSSTGKLGRMVLAVRNQPIGADPCPPDKVRNPLSNRCVKRDGNIGRMILAQQRSPAANNPPVAAQNTPVAAQNSPVVAQNPPVMAQNPPVVVPVSPQRVVPPTMNITYMYVVNRYRQFPTDGQGNDLPILDLNRIKENFKTDDVFVRVSMCDKKTNYNRPGIDLPSGTWCYTCKEIGGVHGGHKVNCMKPVKSSLFRTLSGVLQNTKGIFEGRWEKGAISSTDLDVINSMEAVDAVSTTNGVPQVNISPAAHDTYKTNVRYEYTKRGPKGKSTTVTCGQPGRLNITCVSGGKKKNIKISKTGSMVFWSLTKGDMLSPLFNEVCEKVRKARGVTNKPYEKETYKFEVDESHLKTATLKTSLPDRTNQSVDIDKVRKRIISILKSRTQTVDGKKQRYFLGKKEVQYRSGKVLKIEQSTGTSSVSLHLEEDDDSDTNYVITIYPNGGVQIIMSTLEYSLEHETDGLKRKTDNIEKALKSLASYLLEEVVAPSARFTPKNKIQTKGNKTLRAKQLQHNTITGKVPSAVCRAFTGPQDYTTYHRPEPYSFRGNCSDGLFIDPNGKKGAGEYFYPCCKRMSEKDEKKHRLRLVNGWTTDGDDKTGTFVPGTTTVEKRSFGGLRSLTKVEILEAIRGVKPAAVSFTAPFVGGTTNLPTIKYEYLTPATIKVMAQGKSNVAVFGKHSEVMNYNISKKVLTVTNNVGATKKFSVTDTGTSAGRCVYSCDGYGKVMISTEGPVKSRRTQHTTITQIKHTSNVGLMETLGKAKRMSMVLFMSTESGKWYVYHKNRSACHFGEKALNIKITPANHITVADGGEMQSAQRVNIDSAVEKNNKGYYHIGEKRNRNGQKRLVYLGGKYKKGVYNVVPSFLPNGSIALNKPYVIQSLKPPDGETKNYENLFDYMHTPLTLRSYKTGTYGLLVGIADNKGKRLFYTSSGQSKLSTTKIDDV